MSRSLKWGGGTGGVAEGAGVVEVAGVVRVVVGIGVVEAGVVVEAGAEGYGKGSCLARVERNRDYYRLTW